MVKADSGRSKVRVFRAISGGYWHPAASRTFYLPTRKRSYTAIAISNPVLSKTAKHLCPGFPGDRNERPNDGQWQQQNKQERERKSRQDEPGDYHATQDKDADSGKHKE